MQPKKRQVQSGFPPRPFLEPIKGRQSWWFSAGESSPVTLTSLTNRKPTATRGPDDLTLTRARAPPWVSIKNLKPQPSPMERNCHCHSQSHNHISCSRSTANHTRNLIVRLPLGRPVLCAERVHLSERSYVQCLAVALERVCLPFCCGPATPQWHGAARWYQWPQDPAAGRENAPARARARRQFGGNKTQ